MSIISNENSAMVNVTSHMQVYVMTNRWQFKPMQRMDLGASSQQGISLTSQKAKAGDMNGTAVTASGRLCLSPTAPPPPLVPQGRSFMGGLCNQDLAFAS